MAQSRETDVEKTLERKKQYGGMKRAMYLENYAAMGMLPTPTAVQRDHPERVQSLKDTGATNIYSRKNGEKRPNSILDYINFHQMAMRGMLPTPNASEGFKSVGTENQDSLTKRARYGVLPTPKTSDRFGSGSKDALEKRNREENNDLSSCATFNTDGKNAKLNPQFVAEMMGFPNKWTEKPFIEDAENSFDAVDFNDFPTSYPIVQEEFEPNIISHSRWRRESIKGYGNAVVPQVVLEIFKAIDKYENLNNENQ